MRCDALWQTNLPLFNMASASVSPATERAAVAALVDHTLLKSDATAAQVAALAAEAAELGTHCICVSPCMLPLVLPAGAPHVRVCTVVGFPSGKHHSTVKAFEAARAVADGAAEVDMVIDVGAIKAGLWDAVQGDIAAVRAAAPSPVLLKVILETAALSDEEVTRACQAAEAAKADYVKTSTGFSAAGGTTVHAIELMQRAVGGRLGIKASGGIRTADQARALIKAGATRLGLSGTRALLDEIHKLDASAEASVAAPAAAKDGY